MKTTTVKKRLPFDRIYAVNPNLLQRNIVIRKLPWLQASYHTERSCSISCGRNNFGVKPWFESKTLSIGNTNLSVQSYHATLIHSPWVIQATRGLLPLLFVPRLRWLIIVKLTFLIWTETSIKTIIVIFINIWWSQTNIRLNYILMNWSKQNLFKKY